ncbi:hypothetical protein SAMD00019534_007140, partial [Acytostelium subglobosum LB1]|uniref:hypothetical protein n=1 Tax=Acytostelium subglobosum LB1 TaxID=1410327 RepID=UPI000644CF9F
KKSLQCKHFDVLYTWVNGSDPQWIKERMATEMRLGIPYQGIWRYRDVMGLKYSLRSIKKHLPWARRIFVVTAQQYPTWFNQTMDDFDTGVKFIFHDQLFHNKSHLPTYSSSSIEANFWNLPDTVSDCFIYLNDDIFFSSDIRQDDLYRIDTGQALHFTGWKAPVRLELQQTNPYHASHAYTNGLLDKMWGIETRNYFAHGALLLNKRILSLIRDTFSKELDNDSASPFRSKSMFVLQFVYVHFVSRFIESYTGRQDFNYYGEIRDWPNHMERLTKDIIQKRPKCVCLNDGLQENFNQTVLTTLEHMFETLFPDKQSWE